MWFVYAILIVHMFADTTLTGMLLDLAALCVLAARKDK